MGLKVILDMHCWDALVQPASDDCLEVRQSTKSHDDCDAATGCWCVEDIVVPCKGSDTRIVIGARA